MSNLRKTVNFVTQALSYLLFLFVERKVNELQKKVNGVLQIVKELIKLLHESNIKFPSSLPINDFKIFQDVFGKNKKKLISVSAEENKISTNSIKKFLSFRINEALGGNSL